MSDVSLSQTMIFGHLWQSVALAAVLAGVLILGKRMRGSTRYGLATLAFGASLALPLAAFIPGETIVAGLLKQLNASVSPASVETPVVAAPVAPAAPASPMVVQTMFEEGVTSPPAAPAAPAAPVAHAVKAASPALLFTLPEIKLPDLGLPLLAIWLAGVAFLLARTARDLIAVEKLVARAKPADLPEALKRRMDGVSVVVSPEAPGPMAAGLFRPAIVLPESIALASPGMAALLEHEHAHIRRRDMLAALAQRIVLAFMWWSPALYWMSRRIDEEREVACDEAAVDRTGDARAFARSLTKQAENQLWVRAPKLAVGAIGPRSQFGRRIKRLIEIAQTGGHPSQYAGRLAFAGLALAVAVAAMITPRFTADAQASNGKDAIDLTSPKDAKQSLLGDQPPGELDGRGPTDFDFAWNGKDFSGLGDDFGAEISALMQSIMPELELAFADLSPELQAELSQLSDEMSSLGVEISSAVNTELMQELPSIMEDVRRSLEEAGIDPDSVNGRQKAAGFDQEELRQTLQEAREEMKAALGPELKAEIRQALEEAREEVASHREEIAQAIRESHDGVAIAREAMAAARAEIAAAKARGDFDFHKRGDIKLDFHPGPHSDLYDAADDCNVAEVNRLIGENAVDINMVLPGQGTALMAAADNDCTDAARALVNAGADVNRGFPGEGTPLIKAVESHAMQVVQLLLNRGADVNASVPGSDTPLVEAVKEGEIDMVKLLVEKGADVNIASKIGSGSRPLKMAERYGHDDIAAYLRSKGAKLAAGSAN